LLSEINTPAALALLVAETRTDDRDLTRAAVTVLCQWPGPGASRHLVELASSSGDQVVQISAFRGAVANSANETNPADRFGLLKDCLSLARNKAGKTLVLSQLGQIGAPEALKLALGCLDDPEIVLEAAMAALDVAAKLSPAQPELAADAAAQVLARCKAPAVIERAAALGARSGPFIRNWLVCGPFTQSGIVGATALFPLAFGPEKGEGVTWTPLPQEDFANLSTAFPGKENCVAYLKTQLIAPGALDALLLIGSDDGVKVWLNGEVVHSNNVDRGQIADQDKAPISLKPGTNNLMLKITQGGGGWSACVRIVGADGQPVHGLRVQPMQQ
jgi:hypothetical protein